MSDLYWANDQVREPAPIEPWKVGLLAVIFLILIIISAASPSFFWGVTAIFILWLLITEEPKITNKFNLPKW